MNRKIDHSRKTFAKTNIDTVRHRAEIMKNSFPNVKSIAEICCGDCSGQYAAYMENFSLNSYCGLDIDPLIVKANLKRGIDCIQGSALDSAVMKKFISFDIIFYGPPLSENCDGHSILNFSQVEPGFFDFLNLMYNDLKYKGVVVCICPRTADMGDITQLYNEIRKSDSSVSLPLIHYSYSNKTGNGEIHELRLKYIELWFSNVHEDRWETVKSGLPSD
ncbi:MAG TPA: hypothetical protein PL048_12700 [Leptospiraceae bacterium]|nr:hypothetical protein [Leptospiraceae bacterium]HMZ59633.1 hypothetical protein [Leptospiraceae bacterium]HNF13123.1 hypothetical protein [Leptospiraceae bacterium]HNF24401.1 hypothetical protein [Leptospiraceae bacterium]HNM05713.1 hypothetical protein [Leptospiraceae bacterium]